MSEWSRRRDASDPPSPRLRRARHRWENCEGSSERVGKGASFKWAGAHESISIELRWSFSAFRNFEVGRWALSVCFSAALPSFFFLEMRRVSGAEFSELLI